MSAAPTPESVAVVQGAREWAARIYRTGDWRIAYLLDGRWDHHPDVQAYLARAALPSTEAKGDASCG